MVEYAKKLDDTQWGRGGKSKLAAKIALLASGDDGMVQTALIVSLLASVSMAFPQASVWMVDQVMAITATFMIPAMLITSKLAQYIDKRNLIIFGTVLFMASGLAAIAAPSIELLILTRALLGIGAGLSFPLVPSAIVYLFSEHEKNQMLGWMNACGGILSFVLGVGSGMIAELDWRASFLLYLIFVPILILQWFSLPHFKPEKRERAEEAMRTRIKQVKARINWKMWLAAASMLLFMCIQMSAIFRLSIFVETNGIGTPATSGMASSINTLAAFAISVFFSQYIRLTKKYSVILSLLFCVAFFALLCFATNSWMVYAATICMGCAMGTFNPFMFAVISNVSPDSRKTLGMTMMAICQLGGQIITPYYIMLAAALGFVSDRALFGFTAIVWLVAAVAVTIVFSLVKFKSTTIPTE